MLCSLTLDRRNAVICDSSMVAGKHVVGQLEPPHGGSVLTALADLAQSRGYTLTRTNGAGKCQPDG